MSIEQLLTKHQNLLFKKAAGATLFLKQDGTFPIKSRCKIALFGNGARNTIKGGTGSGDVYSQNFLSIEKTLEKKGFTITTKKWLDAYDKLRAEGHQIWVNKIKQQAIEQNVSLFYAAFGAIEEEHEYDIPLEAEGDVCVYVLARNAGEGTDRKVIKGDVFLTDTEVRDIHYLAEHYKKFLLVLNVASVVDLSPVMDIKNILYLSQLGVATSNVLVNILLGKVNPSGKLATTWAKYEDYQTIGEFGDIDNTRYKEGVYVGYRYFDTIKRQPLFPFGYGLSYTDFSIRAEDFSAVKGKINVVARVRNIGKKIGQEVVQLYVTSPIGAIDKPYQSLVAFAKTPEILPECEEKIDLSFDLKDVATYFAEKGEYRLEKGIYTLRLGNSSRNTDVIGYIQLDEDVITDKLKKLDRKPDFEDVVLEREDEDVIPDKKIIKLDKKDFEVFIPDYNVDRHISPFIRTLSDEALCHFCVGAYKPNVQGSVLGQSAVHICGASGETSNYVLDYTQNKYLVLADGPAGLRIAPKYIETAEGLKDVGGSIFSGLADFLPPQMLEEIKARYKNLKEEDVKTQFTTAIPVASAIAQSFDVDFAYLCGKIVGEECDYYKIQLWLAPALNIHRSILCGRNFEYYSEDPLISGKMASGITKGVQKKKCCGTTIKHYCANNQETNRYNNNSILSERALREIYLRGFEICVKESQPHALMTSYNLLNGEHTSQSGDLIDGVLRGEWGYKGLVMTDWTTTGQQFNKNSFYPPIYASKVVSAGNDIVMPGGQPDFEDLMESLQNGKITRKEIEISATRIYEAILRYAE